MLRDRDFKIVNIDSTIICEKPKMLKYKRKIKQSLASIMKMDVDDISVKATTFEKLGPIGNNEGIACKTIALLEKKK